MWMMLWLIPGVWLRQIESWAETEAGDVDETEADAGAEAETKMAMIMRLIP